MSLERIGNRYAAALMELCAGDTKKANDYLEALENLASIFESPAVSKVMLSPVVKSSMKSEILQEIVEKIHPDKLLKAFLEAVSESGRVSAIPSIARSLKRIVQELENVVEATVSTTFELNEAALSEVKAKLENVVAKKVILTSNIDKTILGGFVVRIGNSIIDMSLRTKLNAMSQAAVK